MTKTATPRKISRRDFLKIGGGVLLATAGAKLLPSFLRRGVELVDVASAQTTPPDLFFAGTDGWIYLPPPVT